MKETDKCKTGPQVDLQFQDLHKQLHLRAGSTIGLHMAMHLWRNTVMAYIYHIWSKEIQSSLFNCFVAKHNYISNKQISNAALEWI